MSAPVDFQPPGSTGRLRATEVDGPSAPLRTGRWLRLVPVTAEYLDFLYELAVDEESGFRFRLVGVVPPPEAFQANLWKGVLSQFVVVECRQATPVGAVVAYDAELHNGFAHVGGAFVESLQHTGVGIEAFDLFCGYLFATFNLRKLYFDVPEYNVRTMANTVGDLLKVEGRLRAHSYYDGRWWDRVILALYREDYVNLPRTERRGRQRGRMFDDDNDGAGSP